ncbi:MAG: hypothetical protein AAF889_12510 [Cyanobacteria bacterium P01_D01_bin.73]
MARIDLNIIERFYLTLGFHSDGNISRSVNNYKHILEELDELENVQDKDSIEFFLRKTVSHLMQIAEANLRANHDTKNLLTSALHTLDRGLFIPYSNIHSRIEAENDQDGQPELDESEKNYLLKISAWQGRLGNNLEQLSTAMCVANKTKSLLTIPDHPIFRPESVGHTISFLDGPIRSQWTDLFTDSLYSLGFKASDQVRRKALLSLPGAFLGFIPDRRITEDTLVIHLRSGDIFSDALNDFYWQPPLAFYRKLIISEGYMDIVIVTETDNINPCAQGLIESLEGEVDSIRLQTDSLQNDINTVLSATNLVASNSSFSFGLALASHRIKRWYRFLPGCDRWDFSAIDDVEQIDWISPDFPGEDVSWSDVDAARKRLLDYPEDKIFPASELDDFDEEEGNQGDDQPEIVERDINVQDTDFSTVLDKSNYVQGGDPRTEDVAIF